VEVEISPRDRNRGRITRLLNHESTGIR
jgi:hypothetical protein